MSAFVKGEMMVMSAGVHLVGQKIMHSLVGELRENGWRVYEVPRGANDKEGFIRAVANVLPMDPPLLSTNNWDAFQGSLRRGFYGARDLKVAIIWADASRLRHDDPLAYRVAMEILTELVVDLGGFDATAGESLNQLLVLIPYSGSRRR